MPAHFLATLPNFLGDLGVAIVLLIVFVTVYLYVTPYDEIALFRANNTAVAISLSSLCSSNTAWCWTASTCRTSPCRKSCKPCSTSASGST
jgi:hypothetical protein